MQIDPKKITNFSRTDSELQSFWIFSCVVAGKNSDFAANVISKLLQKANWTERTPFEYFRELGEIGIRNALVASKSGNYTRITRFISESLSLDLRTATHEQLMGIHGIGPKSSAFFLLHTRPNLELAVLDVHLLCYLRDKGVDAPRQTPSNIKKYLELQNQFLCLAKIDFPFMSIADIDLLIWTKYSGRLDNDVIEPELPCVDA
jgi:thermostable 8-oxoguanine DNA glycosylase